MMWIEMIPFAELLPASTMSSDYITSLEVKARKP